jgi:RNA-directed DNA polymerase
MKFCFSHPQWNLTERLFEGIQSLINGNYTPRCLKRYYFADEMVHQLHSSDRILPSSCIN